MLVYLRKGEPFAQVGAGLGVSTTTRWRYVNETVALLAARRRSWAALRKAKRDGMAYVIIDGTLIPIDRIAADRPFYSGKHKRHGVNLQGIVSSDGTILWGVRRVARQHPRHRRGTDLEHPRRPRGGRAHRAGLPRYDQTRERVITPYRGRTNPNQKDANRTHARLRGPGERANAQLKYWRILHKVRVSPRRTGRLAKAIHVLQNYETTAG